MFIKTSLLQNFIKNFNNTNTMSFVAILDYNTSIRTTKPPENYVKNVTTAVSKS